MMLLPIEMKFAAPVIADEVQVDSDPSSQAEMRLIAPFAEVLMTALTIKKFQTISAEMLPKVLPKVLRRMQAI